MKKTLLILSLIFLPSVCFSEYPKSKDDYRLLPPFCKARASGSKSVDYKKWQRILGKDFLHVHHYCAGLHTLNKARRTRDKKDRNYLLKVANKHILYMDGHANSRFKLFPQIYSTRGEIYELLGNNPKAVHAYSKSINANKKFTRPYGKLADIYYKLGQKDLAVQTIKRGLKFKPKSKSLNRRLKKYQ